jgi:hypothetical protein
MPHLDELFSSCKCPRCVAVRNRLEELDLDPFLLNCVVECYDNLLNADQYILSGAGSIPGTTMPQTLAILSHAYEMMAIGLRAMSEEMEITKETSIFGSSEKKGDPS